MPKRLAACLLALICLAPLGARADKPVTILNVSYDPTRELYAAINPAFAAYWKKRAHEDVTVNQSHGGSGAQARAVIDGLEADVVTLALAYDIDAISQKAHLLPANWETLHPHDSSPYTSTIVFLVRKGNPKHVRDWNDLVKPGVGVIAPNPKTSGGARWIFLSAWGYASKRDHYDEAKTRDFVSRFYKNVVVLDTGSRGATTSFGERGLGDVLVGWENEAILLARSKPGQYQVVVPSISILAEPSVAVVTENARKHGTEDVANAYIDFLYTPQAQRIECENGYRPTNTAVYGTCKTHFPAADLLTIDRDFGGWKSAQQKFFSDGGVFDQISESR
ncbi:MAG TPA: sulfate ABC transporter substrate-binding protein [Candidatus Baltobacteraceae bacterium]|nr:sulfate ABC transporter substrate-binding protein [Candidatus Baltobacteraceae bacterium]